MSLEIFIMLIISSDVTIWPLVNIDDIVCSGQSVSLHRMVRTFISSIQAAYSIFSCECWLKLYWCVENILSIISTSRKAYLSYYSLVNSNEVLFKSHGQVVYHIYNSVTLLPIVFLFWKLFEQIIQYMNLAALKITRELDIIIFLSLRIRTQ